MSDERKDGVATATAELWQRSEEGSDKARRFDPDASPLPYPGNEIERILREYACECYAVGRGESMFYLVEDLPKLARQATREIMAIGAEGSAEKRAVVERTESARKPRKAYSGSGFASLPKVAKSVVAMLPLVAVLAALGIAIGLTFSESIAALVGGR